jgi:hypothetical protein
VGRLPRLAHARGAIVCRLDGRRRREQERRRAGQPLPGTRAPEGTALVFIPSLVAILLDKEKKKGSPFTREEVLAIRENAAVLVIPESAVGLSDERRGYRDIDPSRGWEDWVVVREKRAARG